jgi:hypothetical protein
MRIITSFILACLMTGCATPAQRHTRERLASIIIPEIDFTRATISDVVDFLHTQSVAYDPQEEKKGVGVMLSLTAPEEKVIPQNDPFEVKIEPVNYPTITFKARNISFLDALDSLTRIAGVAYVIDRNGIIEFKPKGPTKSCMIRR